MRNCSICIGIWTFLQDSKIGPTGLYFGEGVCGEMGVKEDPPDPFDEIQEMHENYVSLYTLYTYCNMCCCTDWQFAGSLSDYLIIPAKN